MHATTTSAAFKGCRPEAAPQSVHGWMTANTKTTHAAQDRGSVVDHQQPRVLDLYCVTPNHHINAILVAHSCTILRIKHHSSQQELYSYKIPFLESGPIQGTLGWPCGWESRCSPGYMIDPLCGGRELPFSKTNSDRSHAGCYPGSRVLDSTTSPRGLKKTGGTPKGGAS